MVEEINSLPKILVGIGDLHGHFPALDALLNGLEQQYKIFQEQSELKLKENIELVFTGDYIDRGEQNRRVLATLLGLAEKNPTNVHQLFGNHELLALAGLQRAEEARKKYAGNQIKIAYGNIAPHGYNGGISCIAEFGDTPEAAFEAWVRRLSREGDIGSWMRKLKPYHLTSVGGKSVLFVHGGIPHSLRSKTDLESYLISFESHMAEKSGTFGRTSQKFLHDEKVGSHSIFWDREIPNMSDTNIIQIANYLGVDYIVIGHTPQKEIKNYAGRAFNIDVGMTPRYGENEPAAIVFKPEGVFAFYVKKGEIELV